MVQHAMSGQAELGPKLPRRQLTGRQLGQTHHTQPALVAAAPTQISQQHTQLAVAAAFFFRGCCCCSWADPDCFGPSASPAVAAAHSRSSLDGPLQAELRSVSLLPLARDGFANATGSSCTDFVYDDYLAGCCSINPEFVDLPSRDIGGPYVSRDVHSPST